MKSLKIRLFRAALLLLVVSGCFLMLEIGDGYDAFRQILQMPPASVALNLFTMAAVLGVVWMLAGSTARAALIVSVVSGCVAVTNDYTLKFHGTPFSILDFKNIATAATVAGSYDYTPDKQIIRILIVMAACIAASRLLKKTQGPFQRLAERWRGLRGILLHAVLPAVFFLLVLFFGYLSKNPVKPRSTISWSWKVAYHKYGYLPCSIEMAQRSVHAVTKPEGYTSRSTESVEVRREAASEVQPDIILILNETFYDLRLAVDVETDIPFLPNIDSRDSYLRGYSVTPNKGGGTNCSEYELLTGNSMALMPGVTPFNLLTLKGRGSIVSLLKEQGYSTLGAHCGVASNYSRSRAYPDLGFDRIYFGSDFPHKKTVLHRRRVSDDSAFRSLIEWYEEGRQEAPETPQFLYLLTIQNHGAWDYDMKDSEGIVHVETDFGSNTDIVSEYLSSIRATDEAFAMLTDYFEDAERPVIICMVGDHCPSFLDDITPGKASDLVSRATPMLFWANFDIGEEVPEYLSMNLVAPTLLKKAGVSVTPYMQYLADLSREYPVVTAYGSYFDAAGREYRCDDPEEAEAVRDYFYLEYENILGTGKLKYADD